jgi:hypothetical protein
VSASFSKKIYQEEAAIRLFYELCLKESFYRDLNPRLETLLDRLREYEVWYAEVDRRNNISSPAEDDRPVFSESKSNKPNIGERISFRGRDWPGKNLEHMDKILGGHDDEERRTSVWNGEYYSRKDKTRRDGFWKTDYGFLEQYGRVCDDPFIVSNK